MVSDTTLTQYASGPHVDDVCTLAVIIEQWSPQQRNGLPLSLVHESREDCALVYRCSTIGR